MRKDKNHYHFIYRITNSKNGRYYIGMHSTFKIDDGYYGGGKIIKNSIKKHGKECHIKEILEFLPNRNRLAEREKQLVNEELLKDPLCMNICPGGFGGFSNELQKELNKRGYERMRYLWVNDQEWAERTRKNLSNSMKKSIDEGKFKRYNWNGKKHKPETIQKMKEVDRTGIKNSQFGTSWITNGELDKKIKKENLDIFIKENPSWKKGRK
jgi:hypothetical protein